MQLEAVLTDYLRLVTDVQPSFSTSQFDAAVRHVCPLMLQFKNKNIFVLSQKAQVDATTSMHSNNANGKQNKSH